MERSKRFPQISTGSQTTGIAVFCDASTDCNGYPSRRTAESSRKHRNRHGISRLNTLRHEDIELEQSANLARRSASVHYRGRHAADQHGYRKHRSRQIFRDHDATIRDRIPELSLASTIQDDKRT